MPLRLVALAPRPARRMRLPDRLFSGRQAAALRVSVTVSSRNRADTWTPDCSRNAACRRGAVAGAARRRQRRRAAERNRIEPEDVQGPRLRGASLAVVGDAEEVASLVDPVRGVEALVIEATFLDADAGLAARRGH